MNYAFPFFSRIHMRREDERPVAVTAFGRDACPPAIRMEVSVFFSLPLPGFPIGIGRE